MQRKNYVKKLWSIFLAVAMIVSMMPTLAFAAEATPTAQKTVELPEYIFGDEWNAQYDVLYHEKDVAYTWQGKAVSFPSEGAVQIEGESEQRAIKNKETEVVITAGEDAGSVTITLSNLSTPVSQISGAWNSSYSGTIKATYVLDGNSEASSAKLAEPLKLEGLTAGTHSLTSGRIFEKANQWSPGYDFGQGKVTERLFGYLPDITFEVEGDSAPQDEYLGVNAGSALPDSFTNDIWLQYDFRELAVGETAKLNPRRVEEAITNAIANNVEMPHFNYDIISGDSVTIDTSDNAHAVVTAVKEGNTVVKVTYDAYHHSGGKDFPASDAVNTAYVVYAVGGNQQISVVDNIADETTENPSADQVLMRSYDTVYFTEGETVPFDIKVSTEGAESLTVKCNGITVPAKEAGVYTLPLENRSNIIEMTATAADGTTRSKFRVIDARKIKVNVENKNNPGQSLRAGDTAVISFTGITMPVYKLATIYNPQMGTNATRVVYTSEGLGTFEGKCSQWDLAEKNSFEVTFAESGTYTFESPNGIFCAWWGDPLGSDKQKDNPGAPNLSAPTLQGNFSYLPSFTVAVGEGIPVERLSLDKTALEMEISDEQTLTATIEPENATNKTIHWTSENEQIATVNANGKVTAKSAGTTVIKAVLDGKEAECTVTVTKPVLTAIVLSESQISLYETETQKLTVTYTPDKVIAADRQIQWSSSDEAVAAVDEAGTVTAVKEGSAVITAVSSVDDTIRASCEVEVKALTIESVQLNKTETTLSVGQGELLTATVLPEASQSKANIKWSSSDEDVALVTDKGMVVPLKAGKAVITAAAGEKSASCEVTVEEGNLLDFAVSVSPEEAFDGSQITVSLEGFERPEEIGTETIWSEHLSYWTTIPGLSSVTSYNYKELKIKIPEGTKTGTYYLVNGNYFANFGGFKIQGIFLVNNTEKTFYEGQMPIIKVSVVNREEALNNAAAELKDYKDLSQYRQAQKDEITELIAEAVIALDTAASKAELDKIVSDAKAKLDAIKTDAQLSAEESSSPSTGEKNTVTVYFTLTDGNQLAKKVGSSTPIVKVPVRVGYFDLAEYGLGDYARRETETYVEDGITKVRYKNNGAIVEQPTLLHAYIRFLEEYYNGGKKITVPSNALTLSSMSGPTSLYMEKFYGHNYNLLYYVNHQYPLMYEGFGATADYILLQNGDQIDISLGKDDSFYLSHTFSYFDKESVRAAEGETVKLSLTGTVNGGMGSAVEAAPLKNAKIAYSSDNGTTWQEAGATDENGVIELTFEKSGTYLVVNTTAGEAGGEAFSNFAVAACTVTVGNGGTVSGGDGNGDTDIDDPNTPLDPGPEAVKGKVSSMKLTARSERTSKKNVKVTVKAEKATADAIKELKEMGYTVKYRYYRSTKKGSGYKSTLTKSTTTYTNTIGKKGQMYYYKVQLRVYDKDGKLVAATALKQCKYANRIWTKK